jgi:hypothetical protein
MALKAFEDFGPEPLAFPIGGKTYTAPLVGMREGIRLQEAIEGRSTDLENEPPEVLWRLVLGPVWDEMLTDNVPVEAASRAALAALADFQHGRAVAERVWESGIDPESLAAATAANRKQRRASQRSSSTGAARKTRSRASTTGTSSPRA